MALSEARKKFISDIAEAVLKYAPQYGICVASPAITQAILESGWGESKLAAVYHNYFGMKCGTKWNGKSVNMTTQEEYTVGNLTTIKDNFRVYDSLDEGVKGYFEFIQLERYQNLRGITDPRKYFETIKNDGYATSSTYVENCMAVLKQYELTKYDALLGGTTASAVTAQDIIDAMVEYAVKIANDNSHGYSQAVRSLYNTKNPTSFDCSSLTLTAIQYAFEKYGITPTPKDINAKASKLDDGLSYTGNMLNLKKLGFEVVATNQTAHGKMQKGDLELSLWHHVAIAIDGDNIVHARSSEGTSDTKDGSGNEIRTQPWYQYGKGWTHRLRFTGKGIDFSKLSGSGADAGGTAAGSSDSGKTSTGGGAYMFSVGNVQKGSKGNDVKLLQRLLKSNGMKGKDRKALTIDGDAGTNTDYAIRQYQKKNGLTVDGCAGPKTWKSILLR